MSQKQQRLRIVPQMQTTHLRQINEPVSDIPTSSLSLSQGLIPLHQESKKRSESGSVFCSAF